MEEPGTRSTGQEATAANCSCDLKPSEATNATFSSGGSVFVRSSSSPLLFPRAGFCPPSLPIKPLHHLPQHVSHRLARAIAVRF